MKKIILLNAALIGLMGSAFAMANETEETVTSPVVQESAEGFYIGAGYGTFDATSYDELDNTYGYDRLFDSTSGNTTKLYAGYAFNRIISIEASYSDYGDTSGRAGWNHILQSPKAISIAANAGYSFDNGWRTFGLLGLSSVDLNSSSDYLDTDSPTAIKWGFGGEYTPAGLKGFQLRLAFEADTYFAEVKNNYTDDDLHAFSLTSLYVGASYKF